MPTAPEACTACGASIWMRAHYVTGKTAPIDVVPNPGGNIVLIGEAQYRIVTTKTPAADDDVLHISHFATCPSAARFRRTRT